jgi:hypothetical protein
VQRNGGNVASYFCTPAGRVIHAVGKNVDGNRLLAEARWALDLHHRLQEEAPDNLKRQIQIVEEAHLAKLGATRDDFLAMASKELPAAMQDYGHKIRDLRMKMYGRRYAPRYDRQSPPPSPEVEARYRAANKLHGAAAHQLLAAQPMAYFSETRERMFEKLSGEEFNHDRWRIYSAAEGLATAREKGLPVMLVLYQGHGKDKAEFDDDAKHFFGDVCQDRRVAAALDSFVVVVIPLRELAALSSLADIPLYNLSSTSTPIVILTSPTAEKLAELNGRVQAEFFAQRLWPVLNETRVAHADVLAEQGEKTDALKTLRVVLRSPESESIRAEVQERIALINFDLAEDRVAKDKKLDALRLLRQVVAADVDEEIRLRAEQRIDEIRAAL